MRKARAEVFDRARSILTSPEGGFILVREAGMEFRGEGESGPETARKNKFLFLKNAKEFAFAVRCIKD
jgi:hypothetical protein